MRHIFGNPFRIYPAPNHWPAPVVQLAAAVYDGQDCLASVRQDLSISGALLRDYQARPGKPFSHEAYLTELTACATRSRLPGSHYSDAGRRSQAFLAWVCRAGPRRA